MGHPLADLEELVLKCRDEKARSYISEAVACYKVGAFRSSVVACWIAVCFDVIDKISQVPKGANDRPTTPVMMKVKVETLPRQKISELTGYQYPDAAKK